MIVPHFMYVWNYTHAFRFGTTLSIPEVFFGKLHLVSAWYYVFMFFITTPLLILLLFFTGLKDIFTKKEWVLFAIAVWFFIPFIQSFYHFRQHGVRYIIEIYAPLSIIAAVGFQYITRRYIEDYKKRALLFVPVVLYLFVILLRLTPYHIDYFNIFVGGPRGVYENR